MGGRCENRLAGRRALAGIPSSSSSSSSSGAPFDSSFTGSLVSAAVDGLISCRAEGSRFMWADWMVSANWTGMSDEAMSREVYV